MAVIATLAEAMDADPTEMDPLHSTVDPDALDALVSDRNGTSGDIHVTFTHEDRTITVYSRGTVTVNPGHESTAEKHEGNAEG